MARAAPNQLALVERPTDRRRTYAELLRAGRILASELASIGVGRGDRVVFAMPTHLEHVEAHVACSILGALPAPVHSEAAAWEVERLITDATPVAVVSSGQFWERLAAPELSALILEANRGPRIIRGKGGQHHQAKDGDAVLAYTSGTTGEPKAVRITNDGLINMYRHQCIAHRVPIYGRSVVATQLSFVAATLDMVLAHMYSGSTIVFHERFDAEIMYRTLKAWRPNFVHLAGPMVGDLHDVVQGDLLPRDDLLAVQVLGMSVLPEHLRTWLVASVGNRAMDAYGMTENSGGIVTCTAFADFIGSADEVEYRLRSIGRPIPGLEVKVARPDGTSVDPNGAEVGEIAVRGPSISPGYWNRPDPLTDPDGWYHSGDLAALDHNGFLFLRGRLKDMIKSGGATIYAAEIEDCVKQLGGVRDAAAFGVPHRRWGEALIVAVELEPDRTLTREQIADHCARHLVSFKRPKQIWLLAELPRNRSGKVRKDQLKAEFARETRVGERIESI